MKYLCAEDSYNKYNSVAPMIMKEDGEFIKLKNMDNINYINVDKRCSSSNGFDYDLYGIPDEIVKNICMEIIDFSEDTSIHIQYNFSNETNIDNIKKMIEKRMIVLSKEGKYNCSFKISKNKVFYIDSLKDIYEDKTFDNNFFSFLSTEEKRNAIQKKFEMKINNVP